MVGWLAGVLEGNGERGKMRPDYKKAASHGFFINLDQGGLLLLLLLLLLCFCFAFCIVLGQGRRGVRPHADMTRTPLPEAAGDSVHRACLHLFATQLRTRVVLLKLCGPFLDPASPNFWKRCAAVLLCTSSTCAPLPAGPTPALHTATPACCAPAPHRRPFTQRSMCSDAADIHGSDKVAADVASHAMSWCVCAQHGRAHLRAQPAAGL